MLWHPLDEEIEAVVIASAPGQLVVAGLAEVIDGVAERPLSPAAGPTYAQFRF